MVNKSNAHSVPSRTAQRIAAELRRYFGADAGVRLTATEIGRVLPAASRWSRLAERKAVYMVVQRFKARGYIVEVPGPRGGEGWALSDRGAALVATAWAQRWMRAPKAPAAGTLK